MDFRMQLITYSLSHLWMTSKSRRPLLQNENNYNIQIKLFFFQTALNQSHSETSDFFSKIELKEKIYSTHP